MLVADTYLGNASRTDVAERAEDTESLSVTLSDTERRRSRVRTSAEDGTELGIVISEVLTGGDVLLAEGRPVVVSLERIEAMVLTVDGRVAPTRAIEFGHAIGNRHWELTTEGDRLLVALTEERTGMESFVRPLLPENCAIGYERVSPAIFDGARSTDHGEEHRHDGTHHRDDGSHEEGGHEGKEYQDDGYGEDEHGNDGHGGDGHEDDGHGGGEHGHPLSGVGEEP